LPKEADAAGRPARPAGGSWASVVRCWATEGQEAEADDQQEGDVGATQMDADAPDFVPMMNLTQSPEELYQGRGGRRGRRRGEKDAPASEEQGVALTTVMVSGIPAHHTSETFRQQLDGWGLMGTYNFFYMPMDRENLGPGYAFVNFVDPSFATLCQWLFQQYQFEGEVSPFHVQGLEGNVAHWNQFCDPEDTENLPLIISTPVPSQWAMNGVTSMLNTKLSPQIREQFHKTKICVFHKKNKCALGESCPFAHNKEELQPCPDLAKTKLCYNFFRHRCNDSRCKFAHGYQELRATNNVYKTELCRWWSYGSCKAGSACRYAHGVEELRRTQFDDYGMEYGDFSGMGAEFFTFVEGEMIGPFSMEEELQRQTELMPGGPPPGSAESQSGEDGISEIGFSDASTFFGPTETKLRRQQTAPPTSSYIPELLPLEPGADEGADGDIVLRVKGTFMEAVRLENDVPILPMRRSWSDGDLPQLCEVMAGMDDLDDDDY